MANHLARVDANFLDKGIRTDSIEGRLKSLNLLGYCSNDTTSAAGTLTLGVNDPYQVASLPTARLLTLNHDGTPSELTEALDEALATGVTNIWLTRLEQVYSYEELFCNIVAGADHQVTGFSGSGGSVPAFSSAVLLSHEDRYDHLDISLTALETVHFDILAPLGAYQNQSVESGTKDFGYRVALHCYKIAKEFDSMHAVIPVQTTLHYLYESDNTINYRTGVPSLAQLVSWKDYLVNTSVTNYGTNNFDPIAPRTVATVFFDSEDVNTPSNHAMFLNVSETAVPTLYAAATVAKDANNIPIDLGRYITVVAANTRFRNPSAIALYPTYGYYNKNPYVNIAALMAQIPSGESLSNRSTSLELQDTRKTNIFNTLAGFGFFTVTRSGTRNVFSLEYTAAYHVSPYSRSDYDDGYINREVDNIARDLRAATQPKLGQSELMSIEFAAQTVLKSYIESGVLISGIVTASQRAITGAVGYVNLDVKLHFRQLVKAITFNISLTASL